MHRHDLPDLGASEGIRVAGKVLQRGHLPQRILKGPSLHVLQLTQAKLLKKREQLDTDGACIGKDSRIRTKSCLKRIILAFASAFASESTRKGL